MKTRKSIPYKTKSILQKEIGSVCPFCDNKDVEHFEIHHIDENPENNEFSNLIMLCPTSHSKITKGDISKEEVVKKKLEISSVIQVEVDKDVKPLLDKLKELIDVHEYDKAEDVYASAMRLLEGKNDEYSDAKLQRQYARILNEKYFNLGGKDETLLSCLRVFEKYKTAADIAYTKESLAQTKASLGDTNSAEIFANDFLSFAKTKTDNSDLARAYMIVGYVFMQRDNLPKANESMDEAILYGIRLTHSEDKETQKSGVEIVTFCYQNKSLIFKRLGNISEAKANCIKALEGHKKLEKKKEYAGLLFELAEIECFEGNFALGKWKGYIDEAKAIFREIKDYSWLARCIDLVAKIAYMTGQYELSLKIFNEGYDEIKKTNDKKGIAYFLEQYSSYFIGQKKYSDAEKYLNELIEFATANNLQHSIAHAYDDLANISEKKGDKKKRDEHIDFLIQHYKNRYNSEQSEIKKAYILGKISFYYFQLNDLRSALDISYKIAKIYEEQNIIGEYARTLLGINEINIKLHNRDKLFEIWQKVIDVVEGTAFYEFGAVAKINCGSYLMDLGEYENAQRYLEDAHHLVDKYKLKHAKQVEQLLHELKQRKDLNVKPERTFPYMINRFYEGISKQKDLLEPLLRYWYNKNELDLFRHFNNQSGLRGFLIADDKKNISSTTDSLSWLFSYFLIVSSEFFEKGRFEMFPYPYDNYEAGDMFMFMKDIEEGEQKVEPVEHSFEERLLLELNKPKKDGSHSRYIFAPVKDGDEVKILAAGNSISLPKLAYNFFLTHTADEVINGNHFILHLDRFARKDKFREDIRISWEMNYIPIYIDEELTSDRVTFLGKIQTEIPFGNFSNSRSIAITKKYFNSLFQVSKQNAKAILNDFKFDLDNLFANETKRKKISVSLVEFEDSLRKIIYPVIVLYNK